MQSDAEDIPLYSPIGRPSPTRAPSLEHDDYSAAGDSTPLLGFQFAKPTPQVPGRLPIRPFSLHGAIVNPPQQFPALTDKARTEPAKAQNAASGSSETAGAKERPSSRFIGFRRPAATEDPFTGGAAFIATPSSQSQSRPHQPVASTSKVIPRDSARPPRKDPAPPHPAPVIPTPRTLRRSQTPLVERSPAPSYDGRRSPDPPPPKRRRLGPAGASGSGVRVHSDALAKWVKGVDARPTEEDLEARAIAAAVTQKEDWIKKLEAAINDADEKCTTTEKEKIALDEARKAVEAKYTALKEKHDKHTAMMQERVQQALTRVTEQQSIITDAHATLMNAFAKLKTPDGRLVSTVLRNEVRQVNEDLEAMLDKDGDADFASLKVRIQALASDVNKHISAGEKDRTNQREAIDAGTNQVSRIKQELATIKVLETARGARDQGLRDRLQDTVTLSDANASKLFEALSKGTSLSDDLNTSKLHAVKLESSIKAHEAKYETIKKELDALKDTKTRLEDAQKTAEDELRSLRPLRGELANFKATATQLEAEKTRVTESAVEEATTAAEELDASRHEIQQSQVEIATLRSELFAKQERLSSTTEQLTALQARYDALEQGRDGLIRNDAVKTERIAHLESETANQDEIEAERDALRQQRTALDERLRVSNVEKEEAVNRSNYVHTQLSNARLEAAQAHAKVDLLDQQLRELRVDLDKRATEATQAKAAVSSAQHAFAQLSTKLDALGGERSTLEQHMVNLRRDLNTKRNARETIEATREQLQQRFADLQQRVDASETRLTAAEGRSRTDRDALVRLEAAKGDSATEVEHYRQRCETLATSMREMEAQRRTADIEASRRDVSLRHEAERHVATNHELGELKQRFSALESQAAETKRGLEASLQTSTSEAEGRRTEVAKLETAMEDQRTAHANEVESLRGEIAAQKVLVEELRSEAMAPAEAIVQFEAERAQRCAQVEALQADVQRLKMSSGPAYEQKIKDDLRTQMQSVHNRKLAEKENEIKKLTTLKTELEKHLAIETGKVRRLEGRPLIGQDMSSPVASLGNYIPEVDSPGAAARSSKTLSALSRTAPAQESQDSDDIESVDGTQAVAIEANTEAMNIDKVEEDEDTPLIQLRASSVKHTRATSQAVVPTQVAPAPAAQTSTSTRARAIPQSTPAAAPRRYGRGRK